MNYYSISGRRRSSLSGRAAGGGQLTLPLLASATSLGDLKGKVTRTSAYRNRTSWFVYLVRGRGRRSAAGGGVKMWQLWIGLILLQAVQTGIAVKSVHSKSMAAGRLENVTQTISRILEGYDIRLRPNFGGEPLHVGMDLTIASFDAISEVNMDYTITMYLNQYWKDERLAFNAYSIWRSDVAGASSSSGGGGRQYDQNGDIMIDDDGANDVITLSGDFAEKIWVPDTFFANDKNSFLHDVTERNKLVRLSGDGTVTYGMRFTTTLACMMDLHYYPLDSQNCTVEIESYGYTVSDVVMYWRSTPIRGVEEAELPQFTIIGYETNDRKETLATGEYQRLSLSFKLQRNIGYFVFQTYLPSILIVMLSWVSFWINHEATSARVALGITTVLTMTTISTGVRSSLPRISYVKAIDIYLVMCFVFVFAALLEYAAVNYTYWGARAKKKSKKNKEAEKKVSRKQENNASGCSSEDIIELQDVRMSPIASLRNRHYANTTSAPDAVDLAKFPPSFRISRPYGSSTRSSGLRYRGNRAHNRPKMLHAIKRGASVIKASIPKIKDVNVIDKYSRVIFPVSFAAFNAGYWIFYVLE
ncbi:gamma-aminobutyric acid receptor subunit beta-like [Uranotaenia lowii]|uniref:gamma-aminobutyric acid receptor subunit beta-like n=1 Tax=Uranotaenia lowii TaxID=190385 RepID=UPI00247886F0|nr:gamma-aminobutyric acid receptor subunit beta-like [Uranotaenia lowii]XP_055601277.1 gamma-aminobutyric acid receptor subunit beta-like [Uranotaenia lowii]XP_055601286.1 gamma-aminobutyric acid receptor subunit beta-like [Uranotaenia lowii]